MSHFKYDDISDLYIVKGDVENAMKYRELSENKGPFGSYPYVAIKFIQINKYKEAIKLYENEAKKWDTHAMRCLIKLYDPENKHCGEEEKKCPHKDREKKEYREKKYIEAENIKN